MCTQTLNEFILSIVLKLGRVSRVLVSALLVFFTNLLSPLALLVLTIFSFDALYLADSPIVALPETGFKKYNLLSFCNV